MDLAPTPEPDPFEIFLDEVDELLDRSCYSWAESFLTNVSRTVAQHQHVTSKQQSAMENVRASHVCDSRCVE